jgi:hypothetical protein
MAKSKSMVIGSLKIEFRPAAEADRAQDPVAVLVDEVWPNLEKLCAEPGQALLVRGANRQETSRIRTAIEARLQSSSLLKDVAAAGYQLQFQNTDARRAFAVAMVRPTDVEIKFVPKQKVPKLEIPKFQFVLEGLLQQREKAAKITCPTVKMAKEVSRGFHSSGTGRRLKKLGQKFVAFRDTLDPKSVWVQLAAVGGSNGAQAEPAA